jgi:hypothetical protein
VTRHHFFADHLQSLTNKYLGSRATDIDFEVEHRVLIQTRLLGTDLQESADFIVPEFFVYARLKFWSHGMETVSLENDEKMGKQWSRIIRASGMMIDKRRLIKSQTICDNYEGDQTLRPTIYEVLSGESFFSEIVFL